MIRDKCNVQMEGITLRIGVAALIDDISMWTMINRHLDNIKYIYDKVYAKMVRVTINMQRIMINLLQQAINIVHHYMKINNIPCNRSKTQLLTIMEHLFKKSKQCEAHLKQIYKENRKEHGLRIDITKDYGLSVMRQHCQRDEWFYLRYHDAYIADSHHDHRFMQKKANLKLLGIVYGDFADNLFDIQITKTVQRMRIIRFNCMGLLRKRRRLPIGAIGSIMQSCSVSLLNYCGSILNRIDSTEVMKELKLSRRILNSGCHTLSNPIRDLTTQFPTYRHQIQAMKCREFSTYLRLPESNPLTINREHQLHQFQEWYRNKLYGMNGHFATRVETESEWQVETFRELIDEKERRSNLWDIYLTALSVRTYFEQE
eukprot:906179_1